MVDAKGAARPADPKLDKWKVLAGGCFVLAWLVRAADWLLDIPNRVVLTLQLPLAVLFIVAVVVLVRLGFAVRATVSRCRSRSVR